MDNKSKNQSNQMTMGGMLSRFISSSIILAVTAFFTPGFEIASLWTLLLAAVVLAIMDYLFNMLLGVNATPFGRGIIGFVVSVVVLYATQFFVAGYTISMLSAVVGAAIYGIIAAIVPGTQTM